MCRPRTLTLSLVLAATILLAVVIARHRSNHKTVAVLICTFAPLAAFPLTLSKRRGQCVKNR